MKIKILCGVIGILVVVWTGSVLAQSENEASNLAKEAKTIIDSAKSKDDYQRAAQKYEEALKINEKVKSEKGIGLCSYQLGVIQSRLGQYQKSLEYYEKSLAINKKVGNVSAEASTLGAIGSVYDSLGQYQNALEYHEKSLAIKQKIGDLKGEGISLNNIGLVYHSLGQYQKALEYYEKSLAIEQKIGNVSAEASTLGNIGSVYKSLGQHPKALEYYGKSLAIRQKIGDVKGEGTTLNNIGLVYNSLGQHPKALESYEKSLAIKQKIGDVKGEGTTLSNMGSVCESLGQYPKALEYHEKSLAIMQKIGDTGGEGVTLNNIGLVYRSLGQYQKALEYYGKSLAIRQKIGDTGGEGVTLNNIGLVYRSLGQYPKALEYFEKSLPIRQKIGDVKGEGTTLNNIGLVYNSLGQYQKALEYYEKSLAIDQKIGYVKGEGTTLNNMGEVYRSWGQYAKSLEYYEKSLAIDQKIGYVKGEGTTLNNMGSAYYAWGQYQNALEYYEKTLAIMQKIGAVELEAGSLSNIGNVYRSWGQYPKALEYYEKSLAIDQKIGYVKGEGISLNNIGMVYTSWGQYAKALEYYEKSLAIMQKIGDVKVEVTTLSNIGSVYKSWGQYQKALEYYEKSLAIEKKIGVPSDGTEDIIGNVYLTMGDIQHAEPSLKKANRWMSLGRLALVKSDFNEAKTKFESELNRSIKDRSVDGLFAGHTGLGLSYEGLNQYDKAAEHFKHAIDVTEQIRDSLTPAQRADFYDAQILHIQRITPYQGLARVLMKSGKPEQSFKESEGTKARIFAESLSGRSQNIVHDIPKSVVDQDSDINNRLAAFSKGLQTAYEKGSKDAIESFGRQVKDVRSEKERHIDKLRKAYPLYSATKYPQPMNLEHSALKNDEWTLEYEVTEPGVCIYLAHGKKVVKGLFKPIARKDLDELVRKFREPMELRQGDFIQKLKSFDFVSGKKLSDLLLGDILSDLPRDTPVIIIPDGSLGVVPFEMITLNNTGKIVTDEAIPQISGAEFFGDRNPISYYQSVTALTLVRTLGSKIKPGSKLVVIADPVFQMTDARAQQASETKITEKDRARSIELMATIEDSSQGTLRFNRLEKTSALADNLGALYGSDCLALKGLSASKAEFMSKVVPNLDKYGTVVFATHGAMSHKIPGLMEPFLALCMVPDGTDGFLKMSDILSLKMNTDVVALTACETALGKDLSGEGVMSMGRAFQYAGSSSVLMTLWKVEESSAVQLAESFFKYRKAGKSKLDALQAAKKDIRDAGYKHPYFWSGFILVGETS